MENSKKEKMIFSKELKKIENNANNETLSIDLKQKLFDYPSLNQKNIDESNMDWSIKKYSIMNMVIQERIYSLKFLKRYKFSVKDVEILYTKIRLIEIFINQNVNRIEFFDYCISRYFIVYDIENNKLKEHESKKLLDQLLTYKDNSFLKNKIVIDGLFEKKNKLYEEERNLDIKIFEIEDGKSKYEVNKLKKHKDFQGYYLRKDTISIEISELTNLIRKEYTFLAKKNYTKDEKQNKLFYEWFKSQARKQNKTFEFKSLTLAKAFLNVYCKWHNFKYLEEIELNRKSLRATRLKNNYELKHNTPKQIKADKIKAQQKEIQDLISQNISQREIALRLGIGKATVSRRIKDLHLK
jgi:Trp operon repressor